jgi:UBX domain-containing protein 1
LTVLIERSLIRFRVVARTEEYVPQKRKVNAFGGEGHRLGNVTSPLTTTPVAATTATPTAPATNSTDDIKQHEEAARTGLNLNAANPTTQVQIRLADGSRMAIRVNLTHTVGDLRTYICTARPAYAPTPFMLMTTFPNHPLEDEKLTVEQAKLQNAVIVQRLQ